MNKVTVAVAVALFVSPIVPPKAHAISEGYRNQLIKSGCTQMTDGNGCDIHKTKAQNMAEEKRVQKKHGQSLDQISSEVDSIVGMGSYEFEDYLYRHGWTHTAFGEYTKGQFKMHFVVKDGEVVNAQLTK